MKAFNINCNVYVKFTNNWQEVYLNHYRSWLGKDFRSVLHIEPPPVDENGYTKMQLWQFMEIFGPTFIMGATEDEMVIENMTIYFDEQDLEEA